MDFLREESPSEILTFSKGLNERIEQFHDWLYQQQDETLFVVGHSRYFRRMTGMDRVIDNCSVLHCTFDGANTTCKWKVEGILYCLDESFDTEHLINSDAVNKTDEKEEKCESKSDTY